MRYGLCVTGYALPGNVLPAMRYRAMHYRAMRYRAMRYIGCNGTKNEKYFFAPLIPKSQSPLGAGDYLKR